MHYEKKYAQLLASLPPELRENYIQYRQVRHSITPHLHLFETDNYDS